MNFDVRTDGKAVVKAITHSGPGTFQAALVRNYRDILPEIADKLIATIRAGSWFTNESGNLKKKLYRSQPRAKKSGVEIDVGWAGDAAVYGPVLETGPDKKTWVIRPKGQKTVKGRYRFSKKSGQQGVKMLRFERGGQVFYAKQVTRHWTAKSLRPHVAPAMDRIELYRDRMVDRAVQDAWKAAGL